MEIYKDLIHDANRKITIYSDFMVINITPKK